MAFTDPRRFGRILLRGADPFTSPPLSALAADPSADPLPLDEFRVRMSKSKAPVKAVLLGGVVVSLILLIILQIIAKVI